MVALGVFRFGLYLLVGYIHPRVWQMLLIAIDSSLELMLVTVVFGLLMYLTYRLNYVQFRRQVW